MEGLVSQDEAHDPSVLQKQEFLQSFKALDLDSSGFIDTQNIKEVMSRLGSSLTDEEARKMVEIADYKQNGVIEFDEFVELVTSESQSAADHPRSPALSAGANVHVLLSDEVCNVFVILCTFLPPPHPPPPSLSLPSSALPSFPSTFPPPSPSPPLHPCLCTVRA